MRVFLTDGHYKHTLAATRALGKKGIEVIVGAPTKYAQSFFSKYCKGSVIYPDPYKSESEFIDFMKECLGTLGIDVVLPIGDISCKLFSKHYDEFKNFVKIPIAPWEYMQIASDKQKTMQFAKAIGILIPKIYNSVSEIKYPAVIKNKIGTGGVKYIYSEDDFCSIDFDKKIVQEYVNGDGYGYFGLFDRGKLLIEFTHKRIREFPISGGPSTAAESFYDEGLLDLGRKILTSLNWHGVAMVEFKKDQVNGKFKLMEINPKFWGSLDLAIAHGFNFPVLDVGLAVKDFPLTRLVYSSKKTKFSWPFPDDFLWAKSTGNWKKFFMNFLDDDIKTNIDITDIKPNLIQFIDTLVKICK